MRAVIVGLAVATEVELGEFGAVLVPLEYHLFRPVVPYWRGDGGGDSPHESQFGTKRTFHCHPAMSAFGSKADFNRRQSMSYPKRT
jgi:hypothetical protein